MKRDMELVRKMLLEVEKCESGFAPKRLVVEGYDDEVIGYHCYLIGQAGLAEVIDTAHLASSSPEAAISKLTWEGHEFLDAARDPTTWEKTKQTLKEAGRDLSTVTLGVLQALLIETTKRSIGL